MKKYTMDEVMKELGELEEYERLRELKNALKKELSELEEMMEKYGWPMSCSHYFRESLKDRIVKVEKRINELMWESVEA